jgi:hypothetical protein
MVPTGEPPHSTETVEVPIDSLADGDLAAEGAVPMRDAAPETKRTKPQVSVVGTMELAANQQTGGTLASESIRSGRTSARRVAVSIRAGHLVFVPVRPAGKS